MSDRENFSVTDLRADGVDFVVAAEAGNVVNVSGQLHSKRKGAIHFYLADDADGLTPTAAVPDGGIAIGTNGAIIQTVTSAAGIIVTEDDGSFDIDTTDVTGTGTWYLACVLPGGNLAVSPAITHT